MIYGSSKGTQLLYAIICVVYYSVGVVAQWKRRLTRARKVVGSIPSHGMEELGRSSYKPLPHPTQVQWVLGNRR